MMMLPPKPSGVLDALGIREAAKQVPIFPLPFEEPISKGVAHGIESLTGYAPNVTGADLLDMILPQDPGEAMFDIVGPLAVQQRVLKKAAGGVSSILRGKVPKDVPISKDPTTFYHGTRTPEPFEYKEGFEVGGPRQQFDEFAEQTSDFIDVGSGPDPSSYLGVSFAFTPDIASKFATGTSKAGNIAMRGFGESAGRVIPAKLGVVNPKKFADDFELQDFLFNQKAEGVGFEDGIDIIANFDEEAAEKLFNQYQKGGASVRNEINRDIVTELGRLDDPSLADDFARDLAESAKRTLKDKGHDAVIHKNVIEGGDAIIVFDPEKVEFLDESIKAMQLSDDELLQQLGKMDFKEYGKFGDELAKLKADPEIVAGEMVDGLRVTDDIPNLSSISASDMEEIGGGVRKMSLSGWHANPEKMFYAADDIERTHALAKRIQESGEIDPLIIAFREDGPYVLEGLHRLGALYLLGKKSFPALVVKEIF